MTGRALIAYGVGLIGLILVKILAPGFYAKQDIRTPVKIAIGVLIATQLMNLLFVPWIAHAGLALSIGLGACVNAVFLYWGLRRRGIYVADKGWGIFFLRLVGALFLLAGVALWTAGHFDWIGMQAHPWQRVGALALVMLACGVTYFGALLAMGFRFKDFKRISH
jgi:putative peptidoglycan lipid II flippase